MGSIRSEKSEYDSEDTRVVTHLITLVYSWGESTRQTAYPKDAIRLPSTI
jgi:hypothetical protein